MTQEEYIDVLFDDLGFTISQRKDWLSLRMGKRYSDELNVSEKSRAIELLKTVKYGSEFDDLSL